MAHAPELPAHSAGQIVTEWGGTRLEGPAVLTQRGRINVGDVVHSSHYGRQTVVRVDYSGDENQTSRLVFDANKSEIYPSSSLIPCYSKLPRKMSASDETGGHLAVLNFGKHEVRISVRDAGSGPARVYLGPAERRELAALLLEGLDD